MFWSMSSLFLENISTKLGEYWSCLWSYTTVCDIPLYVTVDKHNQLTRMSNSDKGKDTIFELLNSL